MNMFQRISYKVGENSMYHPVSEVVEGHGRSEKKEGSVGAIEIAQWLGCFPCLWPTWV